MNQKDELPPVDAEILALLAEAKPVPDLDAPTKEVLLARIEALVRPPPLGGGGEGGGDATPPGGGGAGAIAKGGAGALGRSGATIAISLAIGAVSGIAVDRTFRSVPPAVVPVVQASPASSQIVASATELEGVPVHALPSAAPSRVEASVPASRPDTDATLAAPAVGLAAERAQLATTTPSTVGRTASTTRVTTARSRARVPIIPTGRRDLEPSPRATASCSRRAVRPRRRSAFVRSARTRAR